MRLSVLVGLCSALTVAAPAIAQDAAPPATTAAPLKLTEGALIVSADGRRVGRVETITGAPASPVSVTVIKDDQFATIPASTLSAGDHGRVMTTLKYSDIH
jgi:hypothetical protein